MNLFFFKINTLKIAICISIVLPVLVDSQQKPEIEQKIEDSIIRQINTLREEASKLSNVDKAQKAIEKLEYSLQLFNDNTIKNNTLQFGLYVDLSQVYNIESIRNELKSIEYVNKAEALATEKDVKTYDLINFYISLGANEYEESKYEKSLGYITIAYNILKERKKKLKEEIGFSSEKKLEATLLEWFVSLNFSLQNENELLESHRRLENFYEENNHFKDIDYYYALGSFRVGRFYQPNNADKAEYYFNKAETKGDRNIKIYSNVCKGFAFLGAEQFDKIPALIKKLKNFQDLNKFQELNLHEIASRYYSETNNIDELTIHANKALKLLNTSDEPINVLNFNSKDFEPITQLKYPILLNQFALFLEQTNKPELVTTSTELFKIGLKQFADRIDRKPINNHFANYDIIRNRNLKHLIQEEASIEVKQDILSQIERIENRATLNRLLFNRELADRKSNLDSLFSEENKLREEITQIKQKQIEKDTLLNQQLFELSLQLDDINQQLINENPKIFSLNSSEFDLSSIRLEKNTKVIKYIKSENELFRVIISNSDISIKNIGAYTAIETDIISFLNTIKNLNNSNGYENLSKKLYNLLLSDIEIVNNTIIIAEASLRNLPFELLKEDENYLIEKTSISYVSGLSYLNSQLYKSNSYDENITFFAPSYNSFSPSVNELAVRGEAYNLKGAKEEVRLLNKLVDGIVFENENASKSQFFSLNSNSAVLHLAGHAFLNNKDPELSHIVFSDNEEDNKLFISELYGFKSNAELAVLSACNTGVGGYQDGDGLISLSQAFMYSGIPATVSSLWSAPDISTKQIMVSFYGYLNEGLTKSKALRNAKLDYLKNTDNLKLKHPYYWAGFVLYGNDSPINFNTSGMPFYYWFIIGVLGTLLLVYLFSIKKKNSSQNARAI